MAQHDYVIDNSTGANVRADLNLVLQAILSNNSSSSAPSTTAAYMWWADTTTGILKIRNSANNAWVELLQLDGTLTLEDGSASTPALAFRDDLNTGIFSSAADTFNVATGGVERMELGAATVFNQDGADVDFRIEGDTAASLFHVDAGNDRVGINTSTPTSTMQIVGKLDVDGSQNANTAEFVGNTTSGESYGILVDAGTTSADYVANFRRANNDSAFFIRGDGHIGIGTSNCGTPVEIRQTSASHGIVAINRANSDTFCLQFGNDSSHNGLISTNGTDLRFGVDSSGTFNEKVRINSNGKLLIGASTADTGGVEINKNITAESDASDTANYHLVIKSQSNSNTSKVGIAFKNTSSATHVGAAILHHRTGGGSIGDLAFYTSPSEGTTTERTRITSSGTILHGAGAVATQKVTNGGLDIACNNNSIVFGADSNSGNATQARTNNTLKDQRIAAVHYTNAEEPVGVVRVLSDSSTSEVFFGGGSSLFNAATQLSFHTAANNTTASGSERMRLTNGGALRIGRTTALKSTEILTVQSNNGQGLAIGYGTGTNEQRRIYQHATGLYFESTTNQAYLSAAGAWQDASDIAIKKDIEDITYGITTIKNLKPRKYKMKADDEAQIGFIAQEMEEQIPEVVGGKEGSLGISYGSITAVLTKALQEAVTKIEVLETKVATLEAA